MRINSEYLRNRQFADDIVLFSNSGNESQQMIEDLNREIVKVGLEIYMPKTKVFFSILARKQEFMIASKPLESVQGYVYQGILLTGDPDHENEIYRRIKMGWTAHVRHYQTVTGSLVFDKKSVQSLQSTTANIWGRRLKVNKEAREEVKGRTKIDGTKIVRRNVKRQ